MQKHFKNILKELREDENLTQDELGKILKVTRQTISNYEKGKRMPDYEMMEEIADYFNIDLAYLSGKQKKKNRFSEKNLSNKSKNTVPLLGTIAAGIPILAEENIEEYFEIDASIKADFALRIKGDSMIEAGINNGDIAFLRKQQTLETGEIGAVVIENEATLKRFYRTNSTIILQPENKDYQPIVLSNENVHIAGKLVAVLNIVK